MKARLVSCFILLLRICSVNSMESPDSTKMIKMSGCEDVIPFAGTVIAYETHSEYFGSTQGYRVGHSTLKYGYISDIVCSRDCPEKQGYRLHQLIGQHQDATCRVLSDSDLKENYIAMRYAQNHERMDIYKAIKNDTAHFEQVYTTSFKEEDILQLLQNKHRSYMKKISE